MGLQEGTPQKERRQPDELGHWPALESQRAVPGGGKLMTVHRAPHEQRWTSTDSGTSQIINAAIKTPGPQLSRKTHQLDSIKIKRLCSSTNTKMKSKPE